MRPKNYGNRHENIFGRSVDLESMVKNSKIAPHFSASKINQIFLNFFFIEEYTKKNIVFLSILMYSFVPKMLPNFWPLILKDWKTNNLTTIEGPWYFGRVVVPQRLIILSLYHKILLLKKFNDIGEKVLKQSIFSLY